MGEQKTDNRFTVIQSGIQVQAGTTPGALQNMNQAVGFPPMPAENTLKMEARPSLTLGMAYVGGNSLIGAVSLIADQFGTLRLATSSEAQQEINLGSYTPDSATIDATSGKAVNQNSLRRYLCLYNNSINNIFLAFGTGATAVVNKGIKITPGGNYEMATGYGNLFTGEISAIASAAGSQLLIQEG